MCEMWIQSSQVVQDGHMLEKGPCNLQFPLLLEQAMWSAQQEKSELQKLHSKEAQELGFMQWRKV